MIHLHATYKTHNLMYVLFIKIHEDAYMQTFLTYM